MSARDWTLDAAVRCADCGVLRADGEDGLCLHCRLRRMWRSALRQIEARYISTWVALSSVLAVTLLMPLLA
ncbi:hypothetical protein [Pseudothauera hydrothermalis]|jgi:hypothetical protein|uniref:hypothetical protein n=1 Tax=Pseudothauera hydrothermalis TaxID=2184083 RepID=UPI000C7D2A47|nr:hypothetical protein [Pseudothauera hydrothermalis]AUM01189.1 hypothetical protein B4966_14270 [Rhodocyclaceae bacterium]